MIQPVLAESDISPQIILAVLFVVFGGLKWIWENIIKKDNPQESSSEIEDLYEQYRSQIVEKQTTIQQPPAQQIVIPRTPARPALKSSNAPPPIPGFKQKKVVKTKLTAEEKAALERIKKQDNAFNTPRKRQQSDTAGVRKLLKNPNSVRTAIILKEILDKPKILRKEDLN